jgi:hypothetical protein
MRGMASVTPIGPMSQENLDPNSAWIEALGFTPDGQRIGVGLLDTSIVIWDVRPKD